MFFCEFDGCICLLSIEPTFYYSTIIIKFILSIVHISLTMGRFLRKVNPAILLSLNDKKLNLPVDFIQNLKSPIPRSDNFNQFIEDCKNYLRKIRITHYRDVEACTTCDGTCDSCTYQNVLIKVAIDNLKVGSFYKFMIQIMNKICRVVLHAHNVI